MNLFRFFSLTLFFLVSACSTSAYFVPESGKLRDAKLGKHYYAKAFILGGAIGDPVFRVIPHDSGLYAKPCVYSPERMYAAVGDNCVEVKGVPVKAGKVTLNVSGVVYGNMYVRTTDFENDFIIDIKE